MPKGRKIKPQPVGLPPDLEDWPRERLWDFIERTGTDLIEANEDMTAEQMAKAIRAAYVG